jgi:hypothetical protein
MPSRRALLRVSAALAAIVSAACTPILDDFDWDNMTIGPICSSSPCVGLVVETAIPRMLKGDTVRVYTRSDSGLGSAVAWEVSGAGEKVSQSQTAWPVLFGTAGQSILVRGLQVGTADVQATHVSHRTAKTSLAVADSSVIASIALSSFAAPRYSGQVDKVASTSMRVGDSLWFEGTLRDGSGQDYPGRPEGWAVSDTAIARTSLQPYTPVLALPIQRAWVHAKAAGSLDVTATFLEVRQTIRITIVP